jgi:lipopolysaccharide/colanic/teichoic acid biosynthesis glycosyltransferase
MQPPRKSETGITEVVPELRPSVAPADEVRLRPSASGAHLVAWSLGEGDEHPVEVGRYDFTAPAEIPRRVRWVKRVVDAASAVVAFGLLWPVFALVALAIKATSPGPVFYRQERVSRITRTGEQTFFMVKFRTMIPDAELRTGPTWAGEDDPRITPIGRFLRKTRLDEIPQFWNVLRGDMSLVGPRPERPFFTDQLQREIPVYVDRVTTLKPGITGWAQVRLPYDESLDSVRNKVMYDVAYGAHLYRLRTYLKMEVKVILLTFVVVFTGKGAR